MANSDSGTRRVVTSDSARAPGRWHHLARWRHWRAGLGPAVAGILAGIQAVLITFLTITVPAIATYVATSGNPQLADSTWWDALRVGTDIWLLGHGGTTILDGALVTAIPLGISFLTLLATAGTFRRTLVPTAPAWVTAVLSYPLALVLLGSLFASSAGRAGLWRAGLGALALALIGVTTGLLRHEAGPKWEQMRPKWVDRVPAQIFTALRGGVLALCALIATAGIVAGVWIFQGQGAIGDVLVGLGGAVCQYLCSAPRNYYWTPIWCCGRSRGSQEPASRSARARCGPPTRCSPDHCPLSPPWAHCRSQTRFYPATGSMFSSPPPASWRSYQRCAASATSFGIGPWLSRPLSASWPPWAPC